ncbi:MAG: MlaD family protein, partial [Janthinobacterium lividum]
MQARQTLVGLFVLVGLGLAVGAVLVFGRLHLLSPVDRAVIYFHGGVAGLAPGAPVTFRGVRVGSVESVSLHVNPVDLAASIPITLQLDPGRVMLDQPTSGP